MSSFLSLFNRGGISVMQGCSLYSSEEYISNIYENGSFMLSESKKIAALKAMEWGVYKEDKEGNKEKQANHVLTDLFNMPNDNLSFQEMLGLMTLWYDGKDNGYLLEKIVGMKSMKPTINIYNPDNFQVYFECGRIIKITITNPSKVIFGEELANYMWVKQPNPYDSMGGSSWSQMGTGYTNQRAASKFGSYNDNAWRWNNSLVKNSGKRPGLYTSETKMSPEDLKHFREKVEAKNTLDDKGKDIILTGNMKYTPIDVQPQDTDWSNGEKTAHTRVANSLGVPAELVGVGESTYTNRVEANKELYHTTVIPEAKNICKRLNVFLKDWLKAGETIDIDTGSIPALQNDLASTINMLQPLKDRLTINEFRGLITKMTNIDLLAYKGGDVIVVSAGESTLDDIISGEVVPGPDVT